MKKVLMLPGAAVQAVYQLQEQGAFDDESVVIIIFPDHGSKYMNKIYSYDWMKEQGFLCDLVSKKEYANNFIKGI